MSGFEITVIIILLVICGLLWENLRDNKSISKVLYEIRDQNIKLWVIFVINVNIHSRLYGDVNMDIIKNGFLYVITALKKLDLWMLDS